MSNTSELKSLLLENPISSGDPEIRKFVLRHVPDLFRLNPVRVGRIVAAEITEGTDSSALGALSEWPSELIEEVIAAVLPIVVETLEQTREPDGAVESDVTTRPDRAEEVRKRLVQVARAITQTSRGACMQVLTALERFDPEDNWKGSDEVLASVAPIDDPDLALALADALPHRWSKDWRERLSWIDSGLTHVLRDPERFAALASELLGELVKHPGSSDVVSSPFELADYLASIVLSESEEANISLDYEMPSFATPIAAKAVSDRLPSYELIDVLEKKWVEASSALKIIRSDLVEILRAPVVAGDEVLVGTALVRVLSDWILRVGAAEWGELASTLPASPWLISEHSELLQILLQLAEETPDVDFARLGQLAELKATDPVIAMVVKTCELDADDLSAILRGFRENEVGKRSQEAIRDLSPEFDGRDLAKLLDPLMDAYITGKLNSTVFEAIEFGSASLKHVEEKLKALFVEAGNNDDRESVLEIWEALPPFGTTSEKRLCRDIYIPMVRHGKGGVRGALDHFDLVAALPGVRKTLRKHIRKAVRGDRSLERKASKLFLEAGWTRDRTFLLIHRTQDVDEAQYEDTSL